MKLPLKKEKEQMIEVYLSNKERIFACQSLKTRLDKRQEINIDIWEELLKQVQKKYNTFYFDKMECSILDSALISAYTEETKKTCINTLNKVRLSLNKYNQNEKK